MIQALTDTQRPAGPISRRMKVISLDALGQRLQPTPPRQVEVSLVDCEQDLEACYELLHRQYLTYGYTDEADQKLRVNLWNTLPETYTIAARINERIVGTVSFVVDSAASLPMDEIAHQELNALRRQQRKLCEVSGLAIDSDGADSTVLLEMFKYGYKTVRHFSSTTDLVITVNPRHERFYKRVLLFEQIGPTRSYGRVKNAPGVPMRLALQKAEEAGAAKADTRSGRKNLYRFFLKDKHDACLRSIAEGLKRRQTLLTMKLLHEMFAERTGVLRNRHNYRVFRQEWRQYRTSKRCSYEQQ